MKKLLLIVSFCFLHKMNAQVFYVDVNPDSCVCVSATNSLTTVWDLDNDGTADFKIEVSSMANSGGFNAAGIAMLGNNSVAGDNIGAFAINAGDTLNHQPNWRTGTVLIERSANTGYNGHWQGNVDKYLAVQFYSGANLYYGWINVHVFVGTAVAQVALKDYAYSKCQSDCFVKIQKMISNDQMQVYPNPANSNLTIETNSGSKQTVQLYDVIGRMVLTQTVSGKATIDVRGLPGGIYNAVILSGDGLSAKRLVIEEK